MAEGFYYIEEVPAKTIGSDSRGEGWTTHELRYGPIMGPGEPVRKSCSCWGFTRWGHCVHFVDVPQLPVVQNQTWLHGLVVTLPTDRKAEIQGPAVVDVQDGGRVKVL